jgi:serine phosphatase RsbU (regulator of sigma subunit)
VKPDLNDLRHRFEGFAARFAERSRPGAPPPPPGAPPRASPALDEDYWDSLQQLFTRDVTARGLRELVEQDAQDTFQFFTREIDFASIAHRPWYERYPLAVWKVFLATAYRLSPARRILFALAVPLLVVGWIRYAFYGTMGAWMVAPAFTLTLVGGSLFFGLLVLELRDKLALKGDLEVARQIQFGLLPFEPFARDGVQVRVAMRPANTVGGDYFDVIELGGGPVAVVVGDVAGKGMPAALLMALLQGSLRTLITAGFRGSELLAKLNAHLYANIPSNRLITLFYGELDPAAGTLSYVNSGHNAPFLLRRGGAVERLDATAMALGVVGSTAFDERKLRLEEGERLFLYTDGVTEAFDAAEAEYGEERLQAYLTSHPLASHEQLIEGVRADVLAFCGLARPRDDMTLMVVGRGR